MIYFKTLDGRHVIVLEPAEIKKLMLGIWTVTPDAELVVAYTPDAAWTEERLNGAELEAEEFKAIIAEGIKRKAVDR